MFPRLGAEMPMDHVHNDNPAMVVMDEVSSI